MTEQQPVTETDEGKAWSILLAFLMRHKNLNKFEVSLNDLNKLNDDARRLIAVETENKIIVTYE